MAKTEMELLLEIKGKLDASVGKSVKQTQQQISILEKTGAKLTVMGDKLKGGITEPLVEMGKSSISTGAEYEDAISRMAYATKLSNKEAEKYVKTVSKADTTGLFDPAQTAEAITELGKGGLALKDIKNGALDAAKALSAGSELGFGEAANTLIQAKGAFNLGANQLMEASNALIGAADASSLDVSDITESLSQVGAAANNAHWKIQDTTAAIAALGDQGIVGSDAGTSLKTMLQRLSAPTDSARKSMQGFFEQIRNADGSMKSAAEIAGIMKEEFGKLDEATRDAKLNQLFGSDASRAAIVFAKVGKEGIEDYIKATENANAANEAMQSKYGEVSLAMMKFKTDAKWAAIAVFDAIKPVALDLIEIGSRVLSWFKDAPEPTQRMIIIFGVLAAALGPLLIVLGQMSLGLSTVTEAFKNMKAPSTKGFKKFFDFLKEKIDEQASLNKRLSDSFKDVDVPDVSSKKMAPSLSGAQKQAEAVSNVPVPTVPAIGGKSKKLSLPKIGGVSAFGKIGDVIGKVVSKITEATTKIPFLSKAFGVLTKAAGIVMKPFGLLKTAIGAIAGLTGWAPILLVVGGGLIAFGKSIFDTATKSKEFMDTIKQVGQSIKGTFIEELNKVKEAFKGVGEAFGKLGGNGKGTEKFLIIVAKAIGTLAKSGIKIVSGALQILATALKTVAGVAGGAQKFFTSLFKLDFKGMGQGLLQIGSALVSGIGQGIKIALSTLWGVLKDIASGIIKTIAEVLGIHSPATTMIPIGQNIILGIISGIKQLIGNIFTFFTSIPSKIAEKLSTVKAVLTAIWNGAIAAVKTILDGLISYIAGIPAKIQAKLVSIKQILTLIWNAAVAACRVIINKLVTYVSNVVTKIKSLWNGFKTFMSGIFSKVVSTAQSAFDKIKSAISSVKEKISSIKEALTSAFHPIETAIDWVQTLGNKLSNLKMPSFSSITSSVSKALNNIPQMAEGGVVTKPTLAMVGEGAENEAVIPLSRLSEIINNAIAKDRDSRNQSSIRSMVASLKQSVTRRSPQREYAVAGTGTTINYSPTINIQGNADEDVIKKATQESARWFEKQYKKMIKDKERRKL